MLAWVAPKASKPQAEDNIMGEATANPIYVALLCIARCLVPLVILFGISYLLRRFGIVAKPAPPPEEYQKREDNGY
jgi:NADH:ubiquinone oxidoreductase subunit B-like Fe-S oxidoreductase